MKPLGMLASLLFLAPIVRAQSSFCSSQEALDVTGLYNIDWGHTLGKVYLCREQDGSLKGVSYTLRSNLVRDEFGAPAKEIPCPFNVDPDDGKPVCLDWGWASAKELIQEDFLLLDNGLAPLQDGKVQAVAPRVARQLAGKVYTDKAVWESNPHLTFRSGDAVITLLRIEALKRTRQRIAASIGGAQRALSQQ